jgi:predicted enzyme related to lactoylglutathione lyase
VSSHSIVHVELSTNDFKGAEKFYTELFGWQVHQVPEMNYATFMTGEGPAGGFSKVGEGVPAGQTVVYVQTDDIDASLAKAQELGGTILITKMEIPQTGWMGMFQDPTGNRVGLFTSI